MAINFDTLYQALGEGDLVARNTQIVTLNNRLKSNVQHINDLSPGTPMAVRKLITAQLNAYADNGQNVRSRTAFHCTIGWALTMTERILRSVISLMNCLLCHPLCFINFCDPYAQQFLPCVQGVKSLELHSVHGLWKCFLWCSQGLPKHLACIMPQQMVLQKRLLSISCILQSDFLFLKPVLHRPP